jgi:hypothetical protein
VSYRAQAIIYSLPSIESSYASYVCKGARARELLSPGQIFPSRTGISRYDDPERPALIVAMSVMNALESFLWRYIRGAVRALGLRGGWRPVLRVQGLAYGASIRADIESGASRASYERTS